MIYYRIERHIINIVFQKTLHMFKMIYYRIESAAKIYQVAFMEHLDDLL